LVLKMLKNLMSEIGRQLGSERPNAVTLPSISHLISIHFY
jgi:hypothetical protein